MNSHASTRTGKNLSLWVLDTGATEHITFNLDLFTSYHSIIPVYVALPNGTHITASISISHSLTLYNVLYIQTFHVNLISVTKLTCSNYCFLIFSSNICHILQNHSKKTICIARLQRGLFVIDNSSVVSHCNSIISNYFELRHLILGYISNFGMQTIAKQFPLINYKNNMQPFGSYNFGKQNKFPFPTRFSITRAPFKLLHGHLWGSFSQVSILGHIYFITLVFDYSRFTWVIFLKTKSETKQSIVDFVASLENQFNTTL